MNQPRVMQSVISIVLAFAVGTAAAADPPAKNSSARHSMSADSSGVASSSGKDSTSMRMHEAMMDGMKEMHSMRPTGDADKDFARMMEHHHAQAVKMTEAYLKGAKDPKLMSWARKSLDSQQKELKELRALDVAGGSSRPATVGRQ